MQTARPQSAHIHKLLHQIYCKRRLNESTVRKINVRKISAEIQGSICCQAAVGAVLQLTNPIKQRFDATAYLFFILFSHGGHCCFWQTQHAGGCCKPHWKKTLWTLMWTDISLFENGPRNRQQNGTVILQKEKQRFSGLIEMPHNNPAGSPDSPSPAPSSSIIHTCECEYEREGESARQLDVGPLSSDSTHRESRWLRITCMLGNPASCNIQQTADICISSIPAKYNVTCRNFNLSILKGKSLAEHSGDLALNFHPQRAELQKHSHDAHIPQTPTQCFLLAVSKHRPWQSWWRDHGCRLFCFSRATEDII